MNIGAGLATLEVLHHTAEWQRYLVGPNETTMLFLLN